MKTRTEDQKHEMPDTVERAILYSTWNSSTRPHKNLYRKDRNDLLNERAYLLENRKKRNYADCVSGNDCGFIDFGGNYHQHGV